MHIRLYIQIEKYLQLLNFIFCESLRNFLTGNMSSPDVLYSLHGVKLLTTLITGGVGGGAGANSHTC